MSPALWMYIIRAVVRSHGRAVMSCEADASSRLSQEGHGENLLLWPSSVDCRAPLAEFHSSTVLSSNADTSNRA